MPHRTPRMHQRPHDPAFKMLDKVPVTEQRVFRDGCFICMDREFARLGLPLCSPCCNCRKAGKDGHIPADGGACEDCKHSLCMDCYKELAQSEPICTCSTPCCEAYVMDGYPPITCGSKHCPTHGENPSAKEITGEWKDS